MSETATIHSQLAKIRRKVGKVELRRSDPREGESIDYQPNERVLDLVRPLLDQHRVLATPALRSVEFQGPGNSPVRSVVVAVEYRYLRNGETHTVTAAGEGSSVGAAQTNAIKAAHVVLFQIGSHPRPPLPSGPRVTETELNTMVYPLRKEAKLTWLQWRELLWEEFGVEYAEDLSDNFARELQKLLKTPKQVARYKRSGSENGAPATAAGIG